MKKTRKIQLLIGLLLVAFVANTATAVLEPIPTDTKTLVASLPNSSLGALGVVDSYVYKYTSGAYTNQYLYTYKLTSSSMGISFFSIGIDDTASLTLNVANVNYEDDGGTTPANWGPVGTPLQSIDAGFFVTPIYSGQASALLWFICDYSPIMGEGAAFGTSSGAPTFEKCNLYTIPEPATIIMLTTGTLWGYKRRKKSVA